jgi:Cu/Ag efflux protein CusF
MKTAYTLILAAAAALPVAHAQDEQGTTTMTTRPGAASAVHTMRVSAQIVGLDPATRSIVLKQRNGEVTEIKAGERVRNFDQLRVGDIVNAEFEEALSLELKKGGAGIRERVESASSSSAEPGATPGGSAERKITVLADVVAVSMKDQRVKLRGPRGTFDVRVQDPNQLKQVKKGDQVQIVYRQALAISVEQQPNGAVK